MNVVNTGRKFRKKRELPSRPKLAETNAAAILSGIKNGFISRNLLVEIARGVVSDVLANQKQPLEFAIREYFREKGLEVIFYYPAVRSVKVTFQYAPSAYWTIQTVMPDNLQLSDEDREDWLYGSLIAVELPKALREIQKLKNQ